MINRFSDQTAIGIITCNRPDYVKQVLESLDPMVGTVFLINAGEPLQKEVISSFNGNDLVVIDASGPKPVAVGRAKKKSHDARG